MVFFSKFTLAMTSFTAIFGQNSYPSVYENISHNKKTYSDEIIIFILFETGKNYFFQNCLRFFSSNFFLQLFLDFF